MSIREVQFFGLRAPLPAPARFAWGSAVERNIGLVRIVTDDGYEGWGETSVTFPLWSLEERALTVKLGLKPLLLGQVVEQPDILVENLDRALRPLGYLWSMVAIRSAIAAAEVALWDIVGKRLQKPLWALWGGTWQPIPLYAVGFTGTPRDIAAAAADALSDGFFGVKVRVGFDDEADLRLVSSVREAIGDHAMLLVDANMAWDRRRAQQMIQRLQPYHPHWVEEPLTPDDLEGYVTLRKRGIVPLAAGENSYTVEQASALLERQAIDVIMPDIARIGGPTATRTVLRAARAAGTPYSLHHFGSEIGFATALHVCATEPGFHSLLRDVSPWPLRSAFVDSPELVRHGQGHPPSQPGLGLRVDLQAVEQYVVVRTE